MKKISHYKDSKLFKFINICSEIITLIIAYYFSGFLRVFVPVEIAKKFWWREIMGYTPMGIIGAIIIVLIYVAFGDFQTIHVLNRRIEVIWVGFVQLIGTLIMSGLLFMANGGQFSRFWLIMYAVTTWVFILLKRFVCSMIATKFFAKYVEAYRIMLVGSGTLAERFCAKVSMLGDEYYHLVGYVADGRNEYIDGLDSGSGNRNPGADKSGSKTFGYGKADGKPHCDGNVDTKILSDSYLDGDNTVFSGLACNNTQYLGNKSVLRDILAKHEVDQLVIAEENLDSDSLQEILTICSVYGIQVYQIPVFGDYLPDARNTKNADPFIQAFAGDLIMFKISAMNTNNILGVKIAVTNMEKTILDITRNLDAWRGKYICVSNVHTTVLAHDDSEYLKVQNEAVMALPDGSPLSSYSRMHGIAEAERVTGPDLMKEIMLRSGEKGWRHFFYGSTKETLDKLSTIFPEKYPDAVIAGMISPPFRELTPEEDQKYIEMINETKPDFLWVGLGAPKQEIWMAAHKDRINCLMIGVGAAFDYEAGNIKRAPGWMQKLSLEWLYRLLQDPKRLFKRYFITNIKYMWLTRR